MYEIVRGTTPTLSFGLPFSTDLLSNGFVIVKQGNETAIEKELSVCDCENNTITTKLTQEETLSLDSGSHAKIRLVVKTHGGDRHETKTDIVVRVRDTHKDEVI